MSYKITDLNLILPVSKQGFLTYYDKYNLKLGLLAFTSADKCLEYLHKTNLVNKENINTIAKMNFFKLIILLKKLDLLKEFDLLLIDRPFEGGECEAFNLKQLNDIDFENIQ